MRLFDLPDKLIELFGENRVEISAYSNPLNHPTDPEIQYVYDNGAPYVPLIQNATNISFVERMNSSFYDQRCVGVSPIYSSSKIRKWICGVSADNQGNIITTVPITLLVKAAELKVIAKKLGIDWYYVNYLTRKYHICASYQEWLHNAKTDQNGIQLHR